jgi:hypothetical protein
MTNDVAVGIEAVLQLREAELWARKCDWQSRYGKSNWEYLAAWAAVSDLLKDLDIKPLEPFERKVIGLAY